MRRPFVIELERPRRLFGDRGPLVIGLMSDAPAELRAEWL
jgi:hypothetical protein